ncbi:hypothetical protein EDB82DRAFT_493627 [Fusarium venenatum]|uniref:uncharacterized protein n=1 Tax=Fusarium venenatum TaxID=56646 RepID=UPI001DF3AE08|nr:hypothetical protein EDB82DRAFT_493627 [Fusarium venenatum]
MLEIATLNRVSLLPTSYILNGFFLRYLSPVNDCTGCPFLRLGGALCQFLTFRLGIVPSNGFYFLASSKRRYTFF